MPGCKQMAKMLLPTCIFIVVILAWSANGKRKPCDILGSPAEIKDAPWLVSVQRDNKHLCSGVIYSVKFVLTTSECVKDLKISDLKVRAGSVTPTEGGSLLPVCKRLIHGYATRKSYDTNLALLGLCAPLQPSETIREIKEIPKTPADGANVTAFGWTNKVMKSCSLILSKADVEVYSITNCAADRRGWYQPWGSGVTELNICTKKPDKICSYDLGSPLVAENSLVGILSKGDCSKKPDVFSSLVNHKDWLNSNTKE